MYTELVLKCSLKEDIDENAKNILDYLFNNKELDENKIPNHEFFKCQRWNHIGSSSSYYHIPFALSRWDTKIGSYLFSRSDLKNYDDEIDKFLDWINPYIEDYNSDDKLCIGYKWYEEDEIPTLIYKKQDKQKC